MTPDSNPKKSEWMQIAESDNASKNLRKVDKRLTLGTLVTVGAIIIAGTLFANASDEPSAVADTTEVTAVSPSPTPTEAAVPTTESTFTPSAKESRDASPQEPSIAQPPTRGDDDGRFEDGDEHRDREGRGEHRERYEAHEDGDDD